MPAAVFALGVAAFAAAATRVESPHGKLREACADCHAPTGWTPAHVSQQFDHARFGFPLSGGHAATACMSCHGALDFARGRKLCASCHADPHRGELGAECARCHGDRSFLDRGPMVRMHALTRFPLTGGHVGVDCESCHEPAAQGRMQFVGTRDDCRGCHLQDYQRAKSPDHVAGSYPLDCESCHGAGTWTRLTFDHERTVFPLDGTHRNTRCTGCHPGGAFAGGVTACVRCHQSQYASATPPHNPVDFPDARCFACHNATTWMGGQYNRIRR